MRKIVGVGLAAGAVIAMAVAAPALASDASAAKKLVITRADVGSSYTAAKATSNPQTFSEFAACVGRSIAGRKITASVDGPELTDKANGATIDSSVDIVRTKAMAKADRAVVTDPKFADCVARVTKDRLARQGVTSAVARKVNVKRYGDFSAAIDMQLEVSSNGQSATDTVIEVAILKGRAELGAIFVERGPQPISRSTAERILDKVAARIARAHV